MPVLSVYLSHLWLLAHKREIKFFTSRSCFCFDFLKLDVSFLSSGRNEASIFNFGELLSRMVHAGLTQNKLEWLCLRQRRNVSHCATVFLINAFLIAFGNNALLLPKATIWEESRLQWSHFSTHCFTYANRSFTERHKQRLRTHRISHDFKERWGISLWVYCWRATVCELSVALKSLLLNKETLICRYLEVLVSFRT